jgi:hypothetical protein
MSNSSAAGRAISLYRQILRAAIHWADAEVSAADIHSDWAVPIALKLTSQKT